MRTVDIRTRNTGRIAECSGQRSVVITSLRLQDIRLGEQWRDQVLDRWVYEDFVADQAWKEGWISFDCAIYYPEDDRVYLGVTCFDENRIFVAYDRKTNQFVDLGYNRVAEKYDAKFHRSLVRANDGSLYAAPALLHCPDKYLDAPGASIVKYDPASGRLKKLGIPIPHVYVQALAIDKQRQVLYCLHFSPEYLSCFDLGTNTSRILALLGAGYGQMAQGQNIVLDDEGCVWSGWSLTRAWQNAPGVDSFRLCKYDPRIDRMVFFETGLPHPDGSRGFAKADAFFNFGDGAVYATSVDGSFYRIDPRTAEAEFLFTPITDRPSRLSALVKTADHIAYGVAGREGRCELIRVAYAAGTFETMAGMVDAEGEAMCQCHDIVATTDGVLYACENDNVHRSSYLWEIRL